MASMVQHALETVPFAAVFVATRTGTTARMISRFNPAAWIVALAPDHSVCQGLAFSYGVHPVQFDKDADQWREFARTWLRQHRIPGAIAMLAAGPSMRNPESNHRLEFLRIGSAKARTASGPHDGCVANGEW
jgi:pyruvate kinase